MKKNIFNNLSQKFFLGITMLMSAACAPEYKFDLTPESQNFAQSIKYNNKVDIIWLVDNSTSMSTYQKTLADQSELLVQRLNSLKLDYRMVVISTSMAGDIPNGGRFLGTPKVLTNSTPNLVATLKTNLQIGDKGSPNERGLDSLSAVLTPTYLANDGAGFLRSDAFLAVISLSNEDDNSIISVNPLITQIDRLKPNFADGSRSWMYNFIGVLSLTGACTTTSDYAEPGLRHIQMAESTGGLKESICSPTAMATGVSNIHSRIVEILTDYRLDREPDLKTIVVKVNGSTVKQDAANGWTYIATGNLIRFHGSAIPVADAAISVDYKPLSAK